MGVNGILNINKPPGCTSFSIVARVRSLTREKRVGHAGTLDPSASGVLPVCLGKATRFIEYLHDCSKEYIADIKLGEATDTYDAEGRIISSTDPGYVILPAIEQALVCFQGDIEQTPPAYSALKIGGRRSYEIARGGIAVHHKPRRVTIHLIHIVHFELPLVKIIVHCSSGTYIRSLANDLGIKLGCGAHLENLVRSAYGPFKLEDAVSPAVLGATCLSGHLESLLYPPDYPVYGWFKQVVDSETALKIGRGQDVQLGCNGMDGNRLITAYTEDGKLVAVMKFVPVTGQWHPHKVFIL